MKILMKQQIEASAPEKPKRAPSDMRAAHLVGLGFRCWVRGMQTLDKRFFDTCNHHYIQSFGIKDGIVLATKLGNWVDALDKVKTRRLIVHSPTEDGYSPDEAIAIAMIAACQHAECPALAACLSAITKATDLNLPHYAAQDFADSLIDAGQILPASCITAPHSSHTTHLQPVAH